MSQQTRVIYKQTVAVTTTVPHISLRTTMSLHIAAYGNTKKCQRCTDATPNLQESNWELISNSEYNCRYRWTKIYDFFIAIDLSTYAVVDFLHYIANTTGHVIYSRSKLLFCDPFFRTWVNVPTPSFSLLTLKVKSAGHKSTPQTVSIAERWWLIRCWHGYAAQKRVTMGTEESHDGKRMKTKW